MSDEEGVSGGCLLYFWSHMGCCLQFYEHWLHTLIGIMPPYISAAFQQNGLPMLGAVLIGFAGLTFFYPCEAKKYTVSGLRWGYAMNKVLGFLVLSYFFVWMPLIHFYQTTLLAMQIPAAYVAETCKFWAAFIAITFYSASKIGVDGVKEEYMELMKKSPKPTGPGIMGDPNDSCSMAGVWNYVRNVLPGKLWAACCKTKKCIKCVATSAKTTVAQSCEQIGRAPVEPRRPRTVKPAIPIELPLVKAGKAKSAKSAGKSRSKSRLVVCICYVQ